MTELNLAINPNIARLVCSATGCEVNSREFRFPVGLCACCPAPGKPVVVEYHLDRVARAFEACPPFGSDGPGLAEFSAILPVSRWPEDYAPDVGQTPIVRHEGLSALFDAEVFVKNEGVNPSGSFKDRGLAVAVAFGKACGADRFCLPTQGNAGVAASLFSARLGLPPCQVWMPEGYQGGIYHVEASFFGADVRFSGANIAATGRHMREELGEAIQAGEVVDLSTFFEPGRLEGKKTMGLEIYRHFGAGGLPDAILYPTGGGTGLVGIWKALHELAGSGLIDTDRCPLPALVAVQSDNCAPVVRSFEGGLDHVEPVESRGTIADGLDVPGAIMGHGILSAIRESSGTAVAVPDEEITPAFSRCGELGIPVGYESAILVAALDRLLANGTIRPGSSVLLLFTANHLIPLAQNVGHGAEAPPS
jgi:threonine synthase